MGYCGGDVDIYYAECFGEDGYGINYVTITGNNCSYNEDDGIEVYEFNFPTYLTIQGNTCNSNYGAGMYVAYSDYCSDFGDYVDDTWIPDPDYPEYFGAVALISDNVCSDNAYDGIYCDAYGYGANVIIENNILTGNGDDGIYHWCGPYYGSSITIRGNTITSNGANGGYGGIYMGDYIYYSSSYIVEDNIIEGNSGCGIYVYVVEDSSSLIIRNNTIGAGSDNSGAYAGNQYEGIYIDYVCYDRRRISFTITLTEMVLMAAMKGSTFMRLQKTAR